MSFCLIKESIKNLIFKYKYINFLVGFSGGLDSTVLLYALFNIKKKYNYINIRAIYINHNISYLSKKWEKHCIYICKILKIKLIIENIFFENKKKNIEEKSRNVRYYFYKKNLLFNEVILTAHHKNDQCESFILALKRGSGLRGLSGIKKYLNIDNFIIIRPFLDIEKKYIEIYAKKYKLLWINDNNNLNLNFDRVFLRIKIIPELIKRWDFFVNSVNRSAKICYKQEKLINKLLENKYKFICKNKEFLNINSLIFLKKEEIIFILRKWLRFNKKKMLSYKNINLILKILYINKEYISLTFKNFSIHKYKKYIYITRKIPVLKKKIFYWDINKSNFFVLPHKIGFLYIKNKNNKKKNNINLIRKPYDNEKIYIRFQVKGNINILGKNKKKVKKIWQELKVFPWERKITPIIYYNNKPILSPNLFKTKESKYKKYSYWFIFFKK